MEHGAVISNSIIMANTVVGENTHIDQAVVAENVEIGKDCVIGTGEYQDSVYDSRVYCSDLATIGENSLIPDEFPLEETRRFMGRRNFRTTRMDSFKAEERL